MKRLLWVSLLLCGCAKLMGYTDGGIRSKEPIRAYADGADGLKALFTDVLEAAQKDQRERVHDLMATLVMSDDELTSLFGPRTAQLLPRYHKLMETLVYRGAIELVAQVYERKYDTVEVLPVESSGPIVNSTPADRAVARALYSPLPIYAVRLKKNGETRGLRYDFFVYLRGERSEPSRSGEAVPSRMPTTGGGHWRTGNQLGQYIEETRDGG